MKGNLVLSCIILGSLLPWNALAQAPSPQAPTPITYDTFMKQEAPPRGPAFARLSPENRAEIMKTHMRRWLGANDARLSEAQKAVIAENVAALSPDFYREPRSKEWRDKAIALFRKAEQVFSKEDMAQLFTLDGAHIPARTFGPFPGPRQGATSIF